MRADDHSHMKILNNRQSISLPADDFVFALSLFREKL